MCDIRHAMWGCGVLADATAGGAALGPKAGPRVVGSLSMQRRLCPTSLLRNVGSRHSEEP